MDNIQVIVRIRPPAMTSTSKKLDNITSINSDSTIINLSAPSSNTPTPINDDGFDPLTNSNQSNVLRSFAFDRILNYSTTQSETYTETSRPCVEKVLEGYNGTIFCYGQTGSGKSHTIFGSPETEDEEGDGVLFRAIDDLYDHDYNHKAKEKDENTTIVQSVERMVSFYEIYNEKIYDLLPLIPKIQKAFGSNSEETEVGLPIRQHPSEGVYIQGLLSIKCDSKESCVEEIERGMCRRSTAATMMNERSSRSHAVFTIDIIVKIASSSSSENNNNNDNEKDNNSNSKGIKRLLKSRLNVIDLAGSERQSLTKSHGVRLKEAGGINKSLLVLGQVINALVDNNESSVDNKRHVMYRDSKLTYLLSSSLGGNSKTTIIATVSPMSTSFAETMSTLKFAQRAKMIKNKAIVNENIVAGGMEALKGEISRLKNEIVGLKNLEVPRHVQDVGKSDNIVTYSNANETETAEKSSLKDTVVNDALKNIQTLTSQLSTFESYKSSTATQIEQLRQRRMEDKFITKLTHERCQRFARLLKHSRSSRDRGVEVNDVEQEFEDDVNTLCEQIDILNKQVQGVSPEVVEWRVKYEENVVMSALSAFESGKEDEMVMVRLQELVQGLIREKKELSDTIIKNEKQVSASLQTSNHAQTTQITTLQKQLDAAKTTAENKTFEFTEQCDMISKLDLMNVELKAERIESNIKLERVTREKATLVLNSSRDSSELCKLKSEFEDEQKKVRQRDLEIVQNKEREDKKMDKLMSQLKLENERAVNLAEEGTGKDETHIEMRSQLASAFKDNAILIQRLKDSAVDRDSLNAQMSQSKGAIGKLEEEKKLTRNENVAEKTASDELHQASLTRLENDFAAATSSSEKHEKASSDYQRKVENLEAQVKKIKRAKETVEFDFENLQEDHDTMTELIKFLRIQVENLEEDNGRLEMERDEVREVMKEEEEVKDGQMAIFEEVAVVEEVAVAEEVAVVEEREAVEEVAVVEEVVVAEEALIEDDFNHEQHQTVMEVEEVVVEEEVEVVEEALEEAEFNHNHEQHQHQVVVMETVAEDEEEENEDEGIPEATLSTLASTQKQETKYEIPSLAFKEELEESFYVEAAEEIEPDSTEIKQPAQETEDQAIIELLQLEQAKMMIAEANEAAANAEYDMLESARSMVAELGFNENEELSESAFFPNDEAFLPNGAGGVCEEYQYDGGDDDDEDNDSQLYFENEDFENDNFESENDRSVGSVSGKLSSSREEVRSPLSQRNY